MPKASIVGELLLLIGLLAVAYLLYLQQAQLVELELEVDRVRGAYSPVPAATTDNGAAAEAATKAAPRARKGSASGG